MFEFVRLPFGLRNAAQTFQRFTDEILRGFNFCHAYIDDIHIASSDMDTRTKQHLQLVFQCFKEYGIVINPSKCELGVTELTFLGHTLNNQGVRPVQEK